MKKLLLMPGLFLLSFWAQAQSYSVQLTTGTLFLQENISNNRFHPDSILSAQFENRYYVLLRFSTSPGVALQNDLRTRGVKLSYHLGNQTYLASLPLGFGIEQARRFQLNSVQALPVFYKVNKELYAPTPLVKTDPWYVAVHCYPDINRNDLIRELQAQGLKPVYDKFYHPHIIYVQPDAQKLDAIAQLPFVYYVHRQYTTDKLLNQKNLAIHGLSALQSPQWNLKGKDITVAVGDNANVNTHIDFNGRLINRVAYGPQYHGTHVSGILSGAGLLDPLYTGIAPKSKLVSQWFSDVLLNTPSYVSDYNLVATNNSYYSVAPGCPGQGVYDVLSNYIDDQMNNNQNVLHVIAAGNDGLFTCTPYPSYFGTVKSGWQSAKNVMTVGNLDGNTYLINAGSSRGPIKDGRIKPEIVARGTNTLSTYVNNFYGDFSGTSMAAPVIAGATALLQERYKQLNSNSYARAALIKALMCNTAEDLGNAGPDFTYGFGLLNVRRALNAMENNQHNQQIITLGQTQNLNINVPADVRRLKVMLYWSDPAAAANAANALVNDLDLTVSGASGNHQPLVLNANPPNVNDPAIQGVDRVNNMEQVTINNPTAGNHTLTVNGFSIPVGNQRYVLTWHMDMNGVTLEYPYGGEKFVPGESQVIRWNGYGNEANTFTLEYSLNGGGSWITIDNNIPGNSFSYAWTVPSDFTNNALMRISRNGAGYTDISDYAFTIAPLPVLSIANPCPGYVDLSWPAVSGAGSYNILQLFGDSMRVIQNTTATTALIGAMPQGSELWFAVEAVNGSAVSRRSVAKNITPNGGSCAQSTYQNDLVIEAIMEPVTKRIGHSNPAAGMPAPVKIRIKNNGSTAVVGPFDVSYSTSIDGPATETVNTTIAAGGTYVYTFTTGYSSPPAGFVNNFKTWVTLAADTHHENDTTFKKVKLLNNDQLTLPYAENFESFDDKEYQPGEMGLEGSDFIRTSKFDFFASSSRGRARSFVNSGIANSGNRAITLDQTLGTSNTDSLILNLNTLAIGDKQVRMEFFYKNHGQDNLPGNRVWIRKSESDPWLPAYDLYANQNDINKWRQAKININDVLGDVNFASSTFQIKIGQQGSTTVNSAVQELDVDDGYTIDEILLVEALNDFALKQVVSPQNGCGLNNATPITIQIRNYTTAALNNIPVSYRINGGAVINETITATIPAAGTLNYTFTALADFSAYTDYTLQTWVKYPTDTYAGNDTLLFNFHHSPVISSFPYLEGFENSDGNFYVKSTTSTPSSWQWGTPAKAIMNKAPNGNKAWATKLTSNYNDNELSYLYTPCFNLSTLTQPVLSFSHFTDIETDYDYTWVDYSTDGGNTWLRLGTNSTGVNWYDDPGANRWRNSNARWHVASIDIPTTASAVRFRIAMFSDGGVNQEGVGIDDIHIFEKQEVYSATTPVTGLNQNVSGSGWVDFVQSSRRIVSIHPRGQNLGNTVVDYYPNNGAVRHSNNVFYADRNLVVRPANAPTQPVTVRIYFTHAEVNALINASGCAPCISTRDAFELGVQKYTGTIVQENGSLADNDPGSYRFILPAHTQIIPYDNGYYAEIEVNEFSEFWLSKGDIRPVPQIECAGSNKTFSAAAGGSTYQWQENNGSGWVSISDGAVYIGTATQNLLITNIPGTYNGYRYRCLVNGVPDAEQVLYVGVTWTGAVNTDWFNAGNWNCNAVPTQHSYVLIPGNVTNFPVVTNQAAVKSLRVQPGATVTVNNGFSLEVKGN